MQSAYDRDEYVTIHWENMQSGTEHNFNKYTNAQVTHFNTTYDYFSVMHYSANGFSKNGKPTIVPVVSIRVGEVKKKTILKILISEIKMLIRNFCHSK